MENQPVIDEIVSAFEIETRRPPADEAELLGILARQIEEMIERRPDFLFSLLYRNDVSEKAIVAALDPSAPEPGHIGLARAVLDRQKARLWTKKNIPAASDEALRDFQW